MHKTYIAYIICFNFYFLFQVKMPPGCLLLQAGKQFEWLTGGHVMAGFHEVVIAKETLEAMQRQKYYIYIYICLYIYIYVFVCLYIYVFVCLYIYIYVFVCLYIYIYVFVCLYIYVFVCLYIYIYVYIFVYPYFFMFIYVYICFYIYIYIYMFIYLFIHIFLCLYMFIYVFVCLYMFICIFRQANRPLWRVSSTVFCHIASDNVLQPIEQFRNSETLQKYPPTDAGLQVLDELKHIKLKL